MGKVIIKLRSGKLLSFKCKSKERAQEIASNIPMSVGFNFYEKNEKIPQPKKTIREKKPMSFEELEALIKLEERKQKINPFMF